MVDPGRHPHRTLRRDHEGRRIGGHRHDAAPGVDQLGTPMVVHGQHFAGGKFPSVGHDGLRQRLQALDLFVQIGHLLTFLQQKLAKYQEYAILGWGIMVQHTFSG